MKLFLTYLCKVFILILPCFAYTSCQSDDPVSNEEIINLKILDQDNNEVNEVIGDGEGIITLEVTIPENAADSYKTVTFRKSAGQFIGSTDATVVKPVDYDGKARVNLKLPLSNQPLLLSAEIGSTSNKLFLDEEVVSLISIDQVIQLSVHNLQGQSVVEPVRADGFTVLLLETEVMTNRTVLNQVVFNASGGAFQSSNSLQVTKSINSQHKAIVSYKVPKNTGTLFFSSSVGVNAQYFDELNLTLARAHADAMTIEPALITMGTSQGNSLKAYLTRNIGYVSTGTTVTFQAVQSINGAEVNVGRFTGLATAATNENGEITVTFYADTNDITQDVPVIIRVKTLTDTGSEIIREINIEVNQG